MSITYCERVFVVLGMQHAMRMRLVFCGLPGSTILFFTLSHKQQDFRKKKLLTIKCVLILPATFV